MAPRISASSKRPKSYSSDMNQLKLPGFEKAEKRWKAKRAAAELTAREKAHRDWAAGILRSMWENYPPVKEEKELMASGIRIDRFVPNLECERCNLATEDHTMGFKYQYWSGTHNQNIPIKFCLKDYYKKFGKEG